MEICLEIVKFVFFLVMKMGIWKSYQGYFINDLKIFVEDFICFTCFHKFVYVIILF